MEFLKVLGLKTRFSNGPEGMQMGVKTLFVKTDHVGSFFLLLCLITCHFYMPHTYKILYLKKSQ